MLYDLLRNSKYGITGVCQNTSTDISNQFNSLTKLSLQFPMIKPYSDFENLSNITFKVNQLKSSTTAHTLDVSHEKKTFSFLIKLCTPG